MFIYRQKQKGMVLICAVAILAVLSIMATSFVRMMTLNLQAAKNHLNYVDAKFTAIAGIEAAKAKMWEYMLSNKWSVTTGNPNPAVSTKDYKKKKMMKDPDDRSDLFWYPLYKDANNKKYKDLETACKEKQNISLINSAIGSDNTNPFSYSGVVGRKYDNDNKFGRYEYNGNTYALKIQDNQGRLNLNSHKPYNDSSHNSKSNQVINTIIKCLAIQCGLNSVVDKNGNTFDATETIANTLRPKGPTIKTLSSMLEVEGYIDSIVPDTNDEQIAKKLNFLNNVCITSMMDSKCYALANPISDQELRSKPYINDNNTTYYREYRSPININNASVELIAALVQSISSQTRVYMPQTLTFTNSENEFYETLEREEQYTYYVHTYEVSFTADEALKIAKYLLYQNFTCTGTRIVYHSISQLESVIHQLVNRYTSPLPSIPSNAPTNGTDDFRKKRWYNICGDTLKANFNPNIRENFFNPDFIYKQHVTKADLHNGTIPTYSTELCFETYGHIDIQSIGKITANNKNLVVASSVLQESVGFSSITTLTTYNDFKIDGVESENIFPYNDGQDYIANRKESVGYVQASFMTNAFSSCPTACHAVYDGIMMQDIYSRIKEANGSTPPEYNNINNAPEYDGFKQFDITNPPVTARNIYNSSGKMSFWFKPTEHARSPLFCAFFSASYMDPRDKQYVPYPIKYGDDGYSTKSTYRDGIQMFIYKNSNQQIVISRLFFCGYFIKKNNENEYTSGIQSLAVDVDPKYLPGQATCSVVNDTYPDGHLEENQPRKYARTDCIISLSGSCWCENEWNYLDIEWDDSTGKLKARLTLDSGTKIPSNWASGTGYGENKSSSPKFCILNEINTNNNDRIQINGMDRNQIESGKYTDKEKAKKDGRLFIVNTSLHFPGNCTINQLTNDFSNFDCTIDDYEDTIYIPLDFECMNDPNKNPFLNSNLTPETTWGYIGGLNWISYPESPSSGTSFFIRNSSVNYNQVATQLTTNIHTVKMSYKENEDDPTTCIPYSYPDSNKEKIIRKTDKTYRLQCKISMTNANVHPSILDSLSLQILYPYTVASSILQ